MKKMKKWFCSTVTPEDLSMRNVLDECEDIEKDKLYKIEQIVFVNGQYQIFYSRLRYEGEDDE